MKEGIYALKDGRTIRVVRVGRFWGYQDWDGSKPASATFPLNRTSWYELRGEIDKVILQKKEVR